MHLSHEMSNSLPEWPYAVVWTPLTAWQLWCEQGHHSYCSKSEDEVGLAFYWATTPLPPECCILHDVVSHMVLVLAKGGPGCKKDSLQKKKKQLSGFLQQPPCSTSGDFTWSICFVFAPGFMKSFLMCSLGPVLVKAASKTTIMATAARHSGSIRAKEGVTESGELSAEEKKKKKNLWLHNSPVAGPELYVVWQFQTCFYLHYWKEKIDTTLMSMC